MDQELFKFKNFKIFQGVSHAVIVANNATSFEEMFDNEDGDGKDEDRLIGIFLKSGSGFVSHNMIKDRF